MKVCCVVSSLAAGGAERVMTALGNHWVASGHDVTLVTLASASADAYQLDPRVRRVALAMMNASRSVPQAIVRNIGRIMGLRRRIGTLKPDVLLSFNAQLNVVALVACVGLRVPVIVSERAHPPSHKIGIIWALLRRLTYRFAEAVVVQSEAIRDWAHSVARPDRVHVIPNAVGATFISPTRESDHRLPQVLAVGRLVSQKGFDVLIRAFARAIRQYPHWALRIIGAGPEESALRALAGASAAAGAVSFAEPVPDLEHHYRTAGLFILPSRFEGFPNVLLEAMASGCAVIASNCPVGPSDIVRPGVDGVLVPPDDVEALAQEMERLMGDETERMRLGSRAREVAHRFSGDRIHRLWDDLVGRVRR